MHNLSQIITLNPHNHTDWEKSAHLVTNKNPRKLALVHNLVQVDQTEIGCKRLEKKQGVGGSGSVMVLGVGEIV